MARSIAQQIVPAVQETTSPFQYRSGLSGWSCERLCVEDCDDGRVNNLRVRVVQVLVCRPLLSVGDDVVTRGDKGYLFHKGSKSKWTQVGDSTSEDHGCAVSYEANNVCNINTKPIVTTSTISQSSGEPTTRRSSARRDDQTCSV